MKHFSKTTRVALSLPPTATESHRSLFGALLLPVLVAVGASAPTAQAQSVSARVDFASLLCLEETGEGQVNIPFVDLSDEIFVAGGWTKYRNNQFLSAGKINVPAPFTMTLFGVTQTVYPHFGDVDAMEFVFDDNRVMWQGSLQPGEKVTLQVGVWEKDSGYTPNEYAEDMLEYLVNGVIGYLNGNPLSLDDIINASINSISFLFGAGNNDKIGFFTINVWNENGQLRKEVRPNNYTSFGWAVRHEYALVSPSQVASYQANGYFLLGYVYVSPSLTPMASMRRDSTYHTLSATGRTVRMVCDGNGPQRYHASIQVRQGPFTTTNPDGTALTWTVQNSLGRAY